MFSFLPRDMLFEMISFLTPEEYKELYLSVDPLMKTDLKQYTIICKSIVDDDLVLWMKRNEIQIQLLRECLIDKDQCLTHYLTNDKVHSENDEPAVIYFVSESQWYHMWYKMGHLHRDNDLPAVVMSDGYCAWYVNKICIKKQLATGEMLYFNKSQFNYK